MKKVLVISLMLLLVLPVMAGCGGSSPTTEPAENTVLSYTTETYNAGFDFGLFQQVVSEDYNTNVVLSPFSARIALAMTYNGASGETQEAMAKTLEFEGLSLEEVNGQLCELLNSLEEANEEVQLEVANSLWANQEISFNQDFIERCKNNYDAEVATLDFENPEAIKTINDWVKEKTQEKIDKIIEQLDSSEALVLLNAIYFKGIWTYQFDKSLTEEEDFHLLNGDVKKAPMMHQSGQLAYCENEEFQAVSLPYGEERLSMYILLPREGMSYEEFLNCINQDNWDEWINAFHVREGEIALPRFKVEYEKRLDEALKALGMGPAFVGGFEAMAQGGGGLGVDFFISRVQQKTYIDINEEGTEAAAVTGVTMSITSVGPEVELFTMIVNRPFFFAIRDNQTGTLLFMGSIVSP